MAGLVGIVMPVFNDWDSVRELLVDISQIGGGLGCRFSIFLVDDGSDSGVPEDITQDLPGPSVSRVKVVHLAANLGHQRAIAVGISVAVGEGELIGLIIMDADGEDRPDDIPRLLATADCRPGCIILAKRARRLENWKFRSGYMIYKALFRVLAGKKADFGNFCFIPAPAVKRLAHMPELWNNLPGSVMRSRIPVVRVPVNRGTRLFGHSKMNLPELILHGLSALSVYSDLIFVRTLILAGACSAATVLGLLSVTAIRLWGTVAIPGWASTVFGDLIIILLQTVLVTIGTMLVLLRGRSLRPVIPFTDSAAFISSCRELSLGFQRNISETELIS